MTKKTKKSKKPFKYEYVVGVRYAAKKKGDRPGTWIFGCSDLQALMHAAICIISEDNSVINWTATTYKDAKKSGLTKHINSICYGFSKSRKTTRLNWSDK